jgi:adenylate kinase
MTRIILFGAPGSGKGTIGDFLHRDFGFEKISTGDIIREEVKANSPIGRKAEAIIKRGDLVPDEVIIDMVGNRLAARKDQGGYILDGFPRTLLQAEALAQWPADRDLAVFLNVKEEEVIERLSSRLTCSTCGAIFNSRSKPPRVSGTCDICGGRLVVRADDNPETIRQRIRVYLEETGPVIEYFRRRNALVDVDASGKAEGVYERIKKLVS